MIINICLKFNKKLYKQNKVKAMPVYCIQRYLKFQKKYFIHQMDFLDNLLMEFNSQKIKINSMMIPLIHLINSIMDYLTYYLHKIVCNLKNNPIYLHLFLKCSYNINTIMKFKIFLCIRKCSLIQIQNYGTSFN